MTIVISVENKIKLAFKYEGGAQMKMVGKGYHNLAEWENYWKKWSEVCLFIWLLLFELCVVFLDWNLSQSG